MARVQQFSAGILAEWAERVTNEAVDALRDVATDGEDSVRETINAAVTPWGAARAAGEVHGPEGTPTPREHAGRRELDAMYNAVDGAVNEVGEKVWEAHWGWPDPELYYLVQEWGFKEFDTNIVPMEALQRSLDQAEADLAGRLRGLDRGGQ